MKKLLIFQHVDREQPSYIRQYADEHDIGVDVIPLWKPYTIPDVATYDGFVILGGPMGAYEDFPSHDDEITAITRAHGANVPTLGLCLGAQLIAQAFGARVYPHHVDGKHIKEIGHYTVELTPEGQDHGLFKGFPKEVTVLQWHGDTFDLPEGALHLARAPLCEAQAFSYGNMHGLQFHVEIPPDRLKDIALADEAWTDADFDLDVDTLLREADEYAPLMRSQCYQLMDNLLST
jgi:GMP synthase-like glutamine amidotransferase